MWFSLLLILGAIISYSSDRVPMELTSVCIISVLLLFFHFFPLVGSDGEQFSSEKIFSGFSNPALISVISLLVLGQAVVQTGALNEVANVILRVSKNNVFLSIGMSLLFVMIISAFLNNTPVVVIFIPIMAALARAVGLSVSKVMIPLSFVSILGGMVTMIGSSTNLLVSGVMADLGHEPLGFFDFTLPGLFMAGVGLLYVLFIVPKLLPDRASFVKSFADEDDSRQFVAQIEIDYSSDFVGQELKDGNLNDYPDVAVRMIQRGEHAFLPPFEDDIILRPKDIIVLAAGKKDLTTFFSNNPDSLERHLAIFDESDDEHEFQEDISMAEIVVAPASKTVGKTLEQIGFHSQYNCVALGIQRQSKIIRAKVTEIRLAPGDVLLIMGQREDIMALHESKEFLLMEWSTEDIHSGSRAGRTAVIFGLVVGLAALDIIPIFVSAFVGVGAVLIAGCINWRQASRALDLNIILMIGASIALGASLQATGGAYYIAHILITAMDGVSPLYIMSALFVLMVIITNILSNNASAVLFTPIALNLAFQLGVDPRMFIFAVIFACNCSFVTPIGYQTNLMVMGPGHHKFSDFIRSGIPLALIIWLTYCIFAHFYFGY